MRLLIDTGATNSLLRIQDAPPQMIKTKNEPLKIQTAGNPIFITKEVTIPKERFIFSIIEDCTFQVHDFNPEYNGIIENNILLPNNGIIHYKNKILELNGVSIPLFFSGDEEEEYDQTINYLDSIIPDDTIINDITSELRTDHLNSEEKAKLQLTIKKT